MRDKEYTFMAAHDLRAPLMSAKGLLYLMRLESEKGNFDYYAGLLETSIDKMNDLISNMLSSPSGQAELSSEEVSLRTLANESIQSLRYMAGAESVKIDLSVEDGGLFISDRNRLFSIFSNIISNAIRYRDPSKESFIKIGITFNNDGAQFVFEDNGLGIERSAQERVFDKFFRANQEHGGSGLGLYMVKSSIDRLQGTLHMESTEGQGTTFVVFIPNLMALANRTEKREVNGRL